MTFGKPLFTFKDMDEQKSHDLQAGVEAAIEAVENANRLASRLGLTRQAIYAWKKIPAERVPEIEGITGVARHILRPDLHEAPTNGADE